LDIDTRDVVKDRVDRTHAEDDVRYDFRGAWHLAASSHGMDVRSHAFVARSG
jgi:hypothetical protein